MDLSKTFVVSDIARTAREGSHFLTVCSGPQSGRLIPVTEEGVTLGRSRSATSSLEDPAISGLHCRVAEQGGLVIVEDLRSTNGTFVDGARVADRVVLSPGGLLQVGTTLLRLELLDDEEVRRREHIGEDLEKARSYVEALLPPPLLEGPVRTAWSFVPSAVLAGDAFGYHWLDADRFAIYLLDVCGHGIGPALHSVSVVNVIRKGSIPEVDFARPGAVLAGLNETFQMDDHGGMFLTIWYGVYELSRDRLSFASAGHPPALLTPSGGGRLEHLTTTGLPIGLMSVAGYEEGSADVPPGTGLYVFSDGTFEGETRDARTLGPDRFEELIREMGPRGPAAIEAEVRRLKKRPDFDDDFSLLHAVFKP